MRPIRAIRRHFSAKLVLSLFLVAVLVGVIGGFIYFQTGQAVAEDTESTMTHATQLQANTLEHWVDQNRNHAGAIATASPVVDDDRAAIRENLDDEARRLASDVTAVHYVDAASGEVLVSSGDGVGQTYNATRWMGHHGSLPADGEVTVTTTYRDPTIGGPAVAFVSAVPGSQHLIVMPVDLEGFMDYLDRPTADEGSFNQVVNSDGLVITSHHSEGLNAPNVGGSGGGHHGGDGGHGGAGNQSGDGTHDGAGHHGNVTLDVDSPGVRRGLQGEVGTVEMNHHGERIIMGYAPVEGTDWVVMAHISTREAYALQSDVQWWVAALIVSSFLGLVVVGLVIGTNTARSLRDLATTAREMEEGNLDVDLESDRTDEIGQLYGAFDSMRHSLREQIREAKAARDEAEAERERIQRINRELEATADDYSAVMQEAARGDLTARMDTGTENEAMADIATEFNEMLGDIEATIEDLNAFAAEVATASEEVTASSEEVRSASKQISESVQEISVGAQNQNESLQSVNREMSDLSTTIEEIASSSNEVADVAERTTDAGERGRDAAEAAVEGMDRIEEESSEAVAAISALEEEVGQIDELVARIQDIAHQTNMLALNANIEASRTMDSQDDAGFGAVAEEVKELSQEAKAAADEVEDRLVSIRDQTERSAEEVERTSHDVDEASQQVRSAVESLEEIAEYARETNTGVQEISAATEQQSSSTQEVVAMVDEAATISEETTAEAEAAAAAAEEQTTALTEVSGSASGLSEQAGKLSQALDRFETDAASGAGAPDLLDRTPIDDEPSTTADAGGEPGSAPEESASNGATGDDQPPEIEDFHPGFDPEDFDGDLPPEPASDGEESGDDEGVADPPETSD